jgi:hypothetical protein
VTPAPTVYLDECVDLYLIEALRSRGFTVTAARDEGMREESDQAQLVYATAHNWMLLSHNTRHFRRLHREYLERRQEHGGMLLLRRTPPLELLEIRTALMLDWVSTFESHTSRLFLWGQLQQLLQQGLRLPGYSETDVRYALGR